MMGGPAPGGAHRIKITIRSKVRRSERLVDNQNLRKGSLDGFIQKRPASYLLILL